jgi:hypothetical protein
VRARAALRRIKKINSKKLANMRDQGVANFANEEFSSVEGLLYRDIYYERIMISLII